MWDPRTYKDTDFGLASDEIFEPDESGWSDENILHEPHILTVLGPILPDELGFCLPVEYLGEFVGHRDGESAATELEAYFTVGGKAMVDITIKKSHRDPLALRTLSQRVPVHIVAATGVSLGSGRDENRMADEVVREIVDGIENTGILPGVVVSTEVTTHALEENARIAADHGFPHVVLVGDPIESIRVLDRVEAADGQVARTIVGGFDELPGDAIAQKVLDRGAWLCFDRIGSSDIASDAEHAQLLARLINAGCGRNILVSQRLTDVARFVTQGGSPGWIHLPERFMLDLMDKGLTGMQIRSLVVDNPARALTIVPSTWHTDPVG